MDFTALEYLSDFKGLLHCTPIYSHSLEEKKVQEINTTGLFHIPFKLSNEPRTKKIQTTNWKNPISSFFLYEAEPYLRGKIANKVLLRSKWIAKINWYFILHTEFKKKIGFVFYYIPLLHWEGGKPDFYYENRFLLKNQDFPHSWCNKGI